MRPLRFYEVVKVLDTPRTRELGVAHRTGIVSGLPPRLLGLENEVGDGDAATEQYAVMVGEEGFALYRSELEPTGDQVEREALYDGSSLRVSIDGRALDEDEV